MPIYEYKCLGCKKRFSVTLTVEEHGKKKIKCPSCQSGKVEQQVAAFFAVTSKKS